MADGFGTKVTPLTHTPRTASFLILAFGAVEMEEKMAIIVNGDGNQRAVIFLDLMQVISWKEAEMDV